MFFSRPYLAVVGPAPLRFRAASPTNSFIQLPPPGLAKAYAVPTPPRSEKTEVADPSALSDLPGSVADKPFKMTQEPPVIMDAHSPPPIVEPSSTGEPPISPTVFLRYFNGTNAPVFNPGGPGYNPGAPVDFNPPRVTTPAPAVPVKAAPSTTP